MTTVNVVREWRDLRAHEVMIIAKYDGRCNGTDGCGMPFRAGTSIIYQRHERPDWPGQVVGCPACLGYGDPSGGGGAYGWAALLTDDDRDPNEGDR